MALNRALGADEVVCIFGRRGAGKTTLARRMVASARRLVVWDPLGEWGRDPRTRAVGSLAELRDAMRRGWRAGFRLAWAPPGQDLPAELDALARFLWAAQAPFPSCPGLALVVDECNLGLPVHKLRAGLWGMSRAVLQGRHRGLAVLAIAQRPALVSMDLRGQAHRTLCFALPAGPDLAALRPIFGGGVGGLATLPPYTFLEVDSTGIRHGRTRGTGGRRVNPA